MAVPAVTVCESETVYVPAPPAPDPNDVMVVPAVTPAPESVMPAASTPDTTAMTVSVVPEMSPVTATAPVPAGQKEPAAHAAPAGDAEPGAHAVPALHGFAVAAALPVVVQKPAAHARELATDVLDTVCGVDTVYVPAPPAPVPSAVILVPRATPVPVSAVPT
jgi:hypothetical protein